MIRKSILVIDDEKLIRWSIIQKLTDWEYNTCEAENGEQAFQVMRKESPDLVILDLHLPDRLGIEILRELKQEWPGLPVIMVTAYGSIDEAVASMRLGAYDFITKPIDFDKLQRTLGHALEALNLKNELAYYKEKEQQRFHTSDIVADSPIMRDIIKMTKTIARSETSIVLLQGESGTGKDLLAQAIHHLSRRSEGPFLAINCSAIPENLLESELFGYEKGAFTDAKQQKKGQIELAHNGTLFLDEISTLTLPLQAKLLRFLETQIFKRIGGLRDIEVNIRVIAATNQDLEEATQDGTFRQDLFYRLNVCPIFIPPLRERFEDILPLARHFVRQDNVKFRKNIKGINKKAEKVLLDYIWPGNIRELKNALERAMIFEEGTYVTPDHLPIRAGGTIGPVPNPLPASKSTSNEMTLAEMEQTLLINALKQANGKLAHAARILDITRDTLRYKIKKWEIDPDKYRD